MEVGAVKIADDRDFDMLKALVDNDTDWKLEYDKTDEATVCTLLLLLCDDDDTYSCRFCLSGCVIVNRSVFPVDG